MKYFLLQLAQIGIGSDPNSTTTVDLPTTDASTLLTNILNLVYFAAGVIAVIVIIVSAIMYTTSNGDSNKVSKAKNLLTYSIVGLVIIILAFSITNFVTGRF